MMEVGRGGFSSLVLYSQVVVEFSDSETLNISLTKRSWKRQGTRRGQHSPALPDQDARTS